MAAKSVSGDFSLCKRRALAGKVLLRRGVGLWGGDDGSGLKVLSQLARECEDRILLVRQPAGVGVAVVMVMMVMRRARLRAGLLQILVDVG